MKVPQWIVLVLIVVLALAGLGAARLIAIPSVTIDLHAEGEPAAAGQTVTFLVDGVKCVDTARRAASTLVGIPGVIRFVAYASRGRVEIDFDPRRTGVPALIEALEGPALDESSGEYLFHLYKVAEIDGQPVSGSPAHLSQGGLDP